MRFRKVPHNRETEARATGVTRSTGIRAIKALEDARQVFGGNTGTGVAHAKPDTASST